MKQQFFPQRLFMDMKRLIINRLVGLGLLVVGALVSCNAPTAFVPVPSPNPWVDDYTALSSMENYKQWGTYNVHDPACKKIGDTYYMYSTDAIFAENRKEAEAAEKLRDMEEYYTLWVHQIKTPIAAMRILLQSQELTEENEEADDEEISLILRAVEEENDSVLYDIVEDEEELRIISKYFEELLEDVELS